VLHLVECRNFIDLHQIYLPRIIPFIGRQHKQRDIDVIFLSVHLSVRMPKTVQKRLYTSSRLQSVQNAAARFIYRLRRSDHITDALVSLHWLRVPELRITYKIADLTYRSLTGDVPHKLRQFVRVSDVFLLVKDSGPPLSMT